MDIANSLIAGGRYACILFSILMLVYLVKIVVGHLIYNRKEPYPSSLYVMSAMIFMTFSIFFNQIARLSDASDLTWRLPVDVVALGLGAYAVRKREKEVTILNNDTEAVEA